MVADIRWNGGAGDFNWQTAGNWVGGAIPADGDTAIFDSGSISCTTGLTGHAAGNDQLAALVITENYTGVIGSGATPLTLAGGVTTLRCSGRGAFYKFSFTTTTANIDTTTGQTVYLSAGTFTNTYHSGSGGDLKCESAVLTNYYGSSESIRLTADAATAFTLLHTAGYVTTARNIGTYVGKGGDRLVTTGTAAITTSATLHKGSVYNHNSSGTITLLDVGPGASFPLINATKNFTLTAANVWQGGYINMNPPSITVAGLNSGATAIAYIGYGGGTVSK